MAAWAATTREENALEQCAISDTTIVLTCGTSRGSWEKRAGMFEHDIFLSHGWSGNARDEGAVAWVQELRSQLRIALRNPLGRDPAIFLDVNASRTGALTDTLERVIDSSRLFLFVVSPASCQSIWCPWEILRFLERGLCAPTRNDVLLPEDRLFGVTLEQVPVEALPASLRALIFQTYDLTQPVAERDARRPMDWPTQGQAPSSAEFDRLVSDLAKKFAQLKQHEQNKVSPTGVRAFLGAAASYPQEKEFLTPLRRDLLMRGHGVIRGSPAPAEEEEAYRIRLGPLLASANLSVHLLSTPLQLTGWTNTVGTWQLRRAAECCPKLSRFIWEDPDKTPHPAEQNELLSRTDQKFDRRQTWSDLREAVLAYTGQLATVHNLRAVQANKTVVIAYCEEDFAYADAVRERLASHSRLRVQLAMPPRAKAGNRNRINRGLFKEADGLLVYYSGRADGQEEWLYSTCLTARDAIRRAGDGGKNAALVLHPPPPPKDRVHQIGFQNLLRTAEGDFQAIDDWASTFATGGGA